MSDIFKPNHTHFEVNNSPFECTHEHLKPEVYKESEYSGTSVKIAEPELEVIEAEKVLTPPAVADDFSRRISTGITYITTTGSPCKVRLGTESHCFDYNRYITYVP